MSVAAKKEKQVSIHDVILTGNQERAMKMIVENPRLAKLKDSSGRVAVHWACSMGMAELVEFILSQKLTSIDEIDDDGLTPLIIASSSGRINIVRYLIERGANVNATNIGGHGALQYASSKNHFEIVELLLQNNADRNLADSLNATSLHRAASQGHLKVVQLLLQSPNKADVNIKDSSWNTPLHLACEESREETVRYLIAHGGRIDIENKQKKTPIEVAPDSLAKILQKIITEG